MTLDDMTLTLTARFVYGHKFFDATETNVIKPLDYRYVKPVFHKNTGFNKTVF